MEDIYRSFYTNSKSIVSYMVKQLGLSHKQHILEPCAGEGVFIDAVLAKQPDVSIECYDINPEACKILRGKYQGKENIKIIESDPLFDCNLDLVANMGQGFDRIIANPPYGAWQDYSRRSLLKQRYKNLYVKESYTLFLYRAIQLLKESGRLVFIIPDTFLNLHMHKELRKFLLVNTKIIEIALFPSKFFPGVNFGYANLCIITAEKSAIRNGNNKNQFKILTGFQRPRELSLGNNGHSQTFVQSDIYNSLDHALFISKEPKIMQMLNQAQLRIGDVADCVTGIYTGNDKKYLRVLSQDIRNSKKYLEVPPSAIYLPNNSETIIEGIEGEQNFVPIVKGGNTKFLKQDHWFIDWSKKAVSHYQSNSKARFQNSQYYFQTGIAVPMVSSKRITASLMKNRVFDQSIVGVFPKDEELIYYLLAFFNTLTCNQLIRTINPSANNSANYLKKVPYIGPPTKQILRNINQVIQKIITDIEENDSYEQSDESKLDRIFAEIYGF